MFKIFKHTDSGRIFPATSVRHALRLLGLSHNQFYVKKLERLTDEQVAELPPLLFCIVDGEVVPMENMEDES